MGKYIVLMAPVQTLSGYGARSRDIATALINLEYDVEILSLPWGDTPFTGLDLNTHSHKQIKTRIVSNLKRKPDIFIHIGIPNEFQPIGDINIGITAGIETNICRPEWVEGCNKMDLVLTSSKHSQDVFKSINFEKVDNDTKQVVEVLKLTKPCEVLFEGVNDEIYKKKTSTLTTLNNIKEDFCFLFVGHWLQGDLGHDRKDIGMLIHTFLNTFKKKSAKNRPALVLKTSHANFSNLELHEIQRKINYIQELVISQNNWVGSLPNVYVLHGDLTDSEMNDLYNHDKVKAMISFTKGEGFGRPLLEFTMTGKPVIASAWSGQLDFLDPEYSYLLPGTMTQVHPSAANDWILKEGGWFTVNYTYASQIMESCHKMYETFLEKSKKHIKITKTNYTIKKMQDKLSEILNDLPSYLQPKNEFVQIKLPQRISQ